jgi:glycosyltransferase involved in cell wall biosynthesis
MAKIEPILGLDAHTVSCVIPCYNSAETLRRCVRSVQDQTAPVMEIIVVDDCSSDETAKLIDTLKVEDSRIVGLRLPSNGGPGRARNAGWERARGEFIAFLDADDSWHSQKIELQLRLFRLMPELVIVGHLAAVLGEPGVDVTHQMSDHELCTVTQCISRRLVLARNPWSTPTVMLRRDIDFRFAEDQRYAEDYLLWASILMSGLPGARINLPLAVLYKARFGAGGLSGKLWRMEKGELRSIRTLWRQGDIRAWEYFIASLYSLAKYLRRIIQQR